MAEKNRFFITKRIAKHGKQAIIVIPSVLAGRLKPGTIAQITINVLEDEDENS